MATTINGTVTSRTDVEVQSFWSAIKEKAAASYKYSAKVTKDTIVPAINNVASETATIADRACGYGVDATVKFLQNHGNIAMVLSFETMVKMIAIDEYNKRAGNKEHENAITAAVTTQQ